ncbi:MAG: hypothetical protein JNM10_18650, partial [Planctomycetia bacterium]|nr:hypothetical protein [Planctomycetia bacterium]
MREGGTPGNVVTSTGAGALRRATRAFWVALLGFLGMLGAAYVNMRAQVRHARWVDHTSEVIRALD